MAVVIFCLEGAGLGEASTEDRQKIRRELQHCLSDTRFTAVSDRALSLGNTLCPESSPPQWHILGCSRESLDDGEVTGAYNRDHLPSREICCRQTWNICVTFEKGRPLWHSPLAFPVNKKQDLLWPCSTSISRSACPNQDMRCGALIYSHAELIQEVFYKKKSQILANKLDSISASISSRKTETFTSPFSFHIIVLAFSLSSPVVVLVLIV